MTHIVRRQDDAGADAGVRKRRTCVRRKIHVVKSIRLVLMDSRSGQRRRASELNAQTGGEKAIALQRS